AAFGLDWRPGAKKAVLVIGDAPGHDPEPTTGSTSRSVLDAAFSSDPVNINSVVVGGNPDAATQFSALAAGSDGTSRPAPTADDVAPAVDLAIATMAKSPTASLGGPTFGQVGAPVTFSAGGSIDS